MNYFNGKKFLHVVKSEYMPYSLQEKTITPQNQTHEILPDTGYVGLSKVKLNGVLVDPHESYTSQTDNTTAYQKTTPTGALKYASLDKVGGMSYKCFNLCPTATYNDIMNNTIAKSIDLGNLPNGTYTISFNVLANDDNRTFIIYYANSGVVDSENNISTLLKGTGQKSYTFTLDGTIPYDDIRFGINTGTLNFSIELKDLMLNKGSTALPFQPYFEDIRDSAVTSVVSKDSNDTTLDTLTIDSNIQALNGYGLGINDNWFNYIYYNTTLKKWFYVQKVKSLVLNGNDTTNWVINTTSGNSTLTITINDINQTTARDLFLVSDNSITPSLTAYATNTINRYNNFVFLNIGGNTLTTVADYANYLQNNPITVYYPLATPIETDISEYIDNNFIEVEENGTITFNNTYEQSVPSEITYLVEVQQ